MKNRFTHTHVWSFRRYLLIFASLFIGWKLVMSLFSADKFFKPDMEVKVLGLVCPSCAVGLKNSFKRHIKVSELKMDTKKQLLLLDFKEGREGSIYYIKNKEVIQMVEKAGYEVKSIKILADRKPNRYNKP
tara:strand:+ start:784 stop:1176 length:393 start_codon:yes stop_codon:yes gene_type:complete